MPRMFRFECDDLGIYAAVDRDCPRDDARREGKPDGSWLAKIGEDYPGAVSFWTELGYNKYTQSGLKNWHHSVIKGKCRLIIANTPEEILYQDEDQLIVDPDKVEFVRVIPLTYKGPHPYDCPEFTDRPEYVAHYSELLDYVVSSPYSGSEESFSFGAALGSALGLDHIQIHYEILPPKTRSSWPHAHLIEEELVYILEGKVECWINGETFEAHAGEAIYFPPGSNLAHTLINRGKKECRFLVLGEQGQTDDRIHYPLHPERNKECQKMGYYWEQRPEVKLGEDQADPLDKKGKGNIKYPFHLKLIDIEINENKSEDPKDAVYVEGRSFSRALETQRIALHHDTLKPHSRLGIPHAEECEEEFLYILSGSADLWVDGETYPVQPGDAIAFLAGTGIAHTLINNSDLDCEVLVIGERTKTENRCFFPLDEKFNKSCGIYWEGHPENEMGPASPYPK